jgi:hypothetical protein
MAESFVLPVVFKDRELQFNAELRTFGYIHKIAIEIDGKEVLFEPDEERNYRAIIQHEHLQAMEKNRELVAVIVATLEETFK